MIVHNVRATDEILRMIGKHPGVRYIIHGYTGSSETADKLLSYDVYFGIGRTVTYRNPRRLLEALRVIPAERILLETDDPYMDETTALNNLESVLHSLAVILDTDKEKLEYTWDQWDRTSSEFPCCSFRSWRGRFLCSGSCCQERCW